MRGACSYLACHWSCRAIEQIICSLVTHNPLVEISFKVCHSSAFQTISVRSVCSKIINYSGSILANLNNTMQTKQHVMKKPHSYSNRNKIYKGLLIVVEGFWAGNVQNLQFSWNCIQYIFISRGVAFLMYEEYLKQGSNNILKQFLHFFTKNFWEKVDVNHKSLNKIKFVF